MHRTDILTIRVLLLVFLGVTLVGISVASTSWSYRCERSGAHVVCDEQTEVPPGITLEERFTVEALSVEDSSMRVTGLFALGGGITYEDGYHVPERYELARGRDEVTRVLRELGSPMAGALPETHVLGPSYPVELADDGTVRVAHGETSVPPPLRIFAAGWLAVAVFANIRFHRGSARRARANAVA